MKHLRLPSVLCLLSTVLWLTGCTTAIKSDKIVAIKQRSFGIVVGQSPTTQSPEVHLGFVSTVFQMIPTSTNGPISAPKYADTFAIDQGLNPFGFAVKENVGAGDVRISTNATSEAILPK